MKVTITFEIPEKEVRSAQRYWKRIGVKLDWLTWIKESLENIFPNAKRIKVEIL